MCYQFSRIVTPIPAYHLHLDTSCHKHLDTSCHLRFNATTPVFTGLHVLTRSLTPVNSPVITSVKHHLVEDNPEAPPYKKMKPLILVPASLHDTSLRFSCPKVQLCSSFLIPLFVVSTCEYYLIFFYLLSVVFCGFTKT